MNGSSSSNHQQSSRQPHQQQQAQNNNNNSNNNNHHQGVSAGGNGNGAGAPLAAGRNMNNAAGYNLLNQAEHDQQAASSSSNNTFRNNNTMTDERDQLQNSAKGLQQAASMQGLEAHRHLEMERKKLNRDDENEVNKLKKEVEEKNQVIEDLKQQLKKTQKRVNDFERDAKEEIDNRNNNFRNPATHHHHAQHRRSRENDDIESDGDTANHNANGKNNNERTLGSNSTNNNDEHHRNPTRHPQGRTASGNRDRPSLQQQQVPNDNNHDRVDGAINNAHHDHHENRSVPTPKPQANEASTPLGYYSFRRRPPAAPAKKTKTYRQEMNSGRERKPRCPYDEDWLRGKPNIDSTALLPSVAKPNLPSHMGADSEVQQRKNEEQSQLQCYRNRRHATPAKVAAARTKMAELLTRSLSCTSSNLPSAQNRHQGGDSSGSLQQQQVPNDNNHDGAQQHRSLSAGSATNSNKNNTSTSDEE